MDTSAQPITANTRRNTSPAAKSASFERRQLSKFCPKIRSVAGKLHVKSFGTAQPPGGSVQLAPRICCEWVLTMRSPVHAHGLAAK